MGSGLCFRWPELNTLRGSVQSAAAPSASARSIHPTPATKADPVSAWLSAAASFLRTAGAFGPKQTSARAAGFNSRLRGPLPPALLRPRSDRVGRTFKNASTSVALQMNTIAHDRQALCTFRAAPQSKALPRGTVQITRLFRNPRCGGHRSGTAGSDAPRRCRAGRS